PRDADRVTAKSEKAETGGKTRAQAHGGTARMPDLLEGGQRGSAGSPCGVGDFQMQRRRHKEAHLRPGVPGEGWPQLDDLIGVIPFRCPVYSALNEVEIHVPGGPPGDVRTGSEDVKPTRRVGRARAHAGDSVDSSAELERDVCAGEVGGPDLGF